MLDQLQAARVGKSGASTKLAKPSRRNNGLWDSKPFQSRSTVTDIPAIHNSIPCKNYSSEGEAERDINVVSSGEVLVCLNCVDMLQHCTVADCCGPALLSCSPLVSNWVLKSVCAGMRRILLPGKQQMDALHLESKVSSLP